VSVRRVRQQERVVCENACGTNRPCCDWERRCRSLVPWRGTERAEARKKGAVERAVVVGTPYRAETKTYSATARTEEDRNRHGTAEEDDDVDDAMVEESGSS
jgi:hypothetical protein